MAVESAGLVPAAKFALPVLLALAAVVDYRRRRIPNALSFGGMAAGLLLGLVSGGAPGLLGSFLGLLTGGALFLPFYLARGLGAGDVKLMAAVGAFLGPGHTLWAAITVALLGGVIAAWAAFRQRRLAQALRDTAGVVFRVRPLKTLDASSREESIPYGLAIAAGVLLYLVLLAHAA